MKKPDDRTRGAGLGDTDTKPTPLCPATELPTRKWLEIHRRGIATSGLPASMKSFLIYSSVNSQKNLTPGALLYP